MIDADLAAIYGVTTKRLNEQVKRNSGRFPNDFMIRLTLQEKAEVVAKCDHLRGLRFSPTLPFAFTEHGAVMLAAVLNSPRAVQASVSIARAFVRLRRLAFGRRERKKEDSPRDWVRFLEREDRAGLFERLGRDNGGTGFRQDARRTELFIGAPRILLGPWALAAHAPGG